MKHLRIGNVIVKNTNSMTIVNRSHSSKTFSISLSFHCPHQLFHTIKSKMNALADNDPDWAQVTLRRKNGNRDSSNNSDASGSCSIGSNSFAFNFDAAHMATDEAMMNNDQRQAADKQAAEVAVASLASIATSYSKEVQGEPFAQRISLVHSIASLHQTHTSFLSQEG